MPGAIVLLIVLAVFPLVACLGSVAIAALLGFVLDQDAAIRNEGSELVELNV